VNVGVIQGLRHQPVHHPLSYLFSGARPSSSAAASKAREMSVKIQRVGPDGACCARGRARSAKTHTGLPNAPNRQMQPLFLLFLKFLNGSMYSRKHSGLYFPAIDPA